MSNIGGLNVKYVHLSSQKAQNHLNSNYININSHWIVPNQICVYVVDWKKIITLTLSFVLTRGLQDGKLYGHNMRSSIFIICNIQLDVIITIVIRWLNVGHCYIDPGHLCFIIW